MCSTLLGLFSSYVNMLLIKFHTLIIEVFQEVLFRYKDCFRDLVHFQKWDFWKSFYLLFPGYGFSFPMGQSVNSFSFCSYVLASYARFLWDAEEDEEEDEGNERVQHGTDQSHTSSSNFYHGAHQHSPLTAAS